MDPSETKLDPPENFSDLPPESFWVSQDDEQDWFDRNAVIQRKTSLKLGFNRNFNSFSHRSELIIPSANKKLSRPSIIGLPKPLNSSGIDPEKKTGRFLFRSRSEPGGKPTVNVTEPVSPRVSCTGRVGLRSGDRRKTRFTRIFSSLFGARPKRGKGMFVESG